jgi:hypothetical protein
MTTAIHRRSLGSATILVKPNIDLR